jgi:hypothetical protein
MEKNTTGDSSKTKAMVGKNVNLTIHFSPLTFNQPFRPHIPVN